MSAERPSTLQLTYEDYILIPDDGQRHEIIDGEEYVSPSPSTPHQRVVGVFFNRLYNHVTANDLGEVFAAPLDVILSDTYIVQPDVLFVSEDRSSIITERGIEGAPDLIIEVLSEGNRRYDEVRKRQLYERFEVSEYWIADPALETVKVYRLTDAGYERAAELSAEAGDTLTTPPLPDFAVTLTTSSRPHAESCLGAVRWSTGF